MFSPSTAPVLTFGAGASSGNVQAMALDGSTLYLAGNFSLVAGQPRPGLAAVDAATGALKPWAPDVNRTGSEAAAVANGTVFACGSFTGVGGVPRTNLAALDLAAGHPTSWAPQIDAGPSDMVTDGTWLYLGGGFHNVNGSAQSFLARVSVASGALDLSWSPTPSSNVTCLALSGSV